MGEYEGHIDLREGVVLVLTVLTATLFLQTPQYLIEVGGPAGWQVALVMTGSAALLLLPMIALAGRFPGRGLAEISVEAAGPILGPLLTLPVTLWLLLSAALSVRNFTETFLIAILPDTPPSVLITVVIGCAVFASYQGLEAVGRASLILLPLVAGGGLLVLLFSLPRVDLTLMYPFWGQGLIPTLVGGAYYGTLATEVIFLLVVGYAFREGRVLRSSALRGILYFGIGAALTAWVLVCVFSSPIASQNPFPLFNLARLIYLGRFLQRTEAVIVMLWFFAAAVRISVLLHASVVSLAGSLRLPYYRPLLFPAAVILMALALVPQNFLEVLRLNRDWLRPAGFVVLTIPLLLWVLAAVRGKGGSAHAA
ncbi:MAG: GerAB/ArcD/ProY family transporter [Bacillota bacterium]